MLQLHTLYIACSNRFNWFCNTEGNVKMLHSQGNLSLYLFLFIMLAFFAKLMSAMHGT